VLGCVPPYKIIVCNIEECENYTHITYVKLALTKTRFEKFNQKITQRVFFVYSMLAFNNLFYSLGLRHMFIGKILPVIAMH